MGRDFSIVVLLLLLTCFELCNSKWNTDSSCVSVCISETSPGSSQNGSRCIPLPVGECINSTLLLKNDTTGAEKAAFSRIDIEMVEYLNLTSSNISNTTTILPEIYQGTLIKLILEWIVPDPDVLSSDSSVFQLEIHGNKSAEELLDFTTSYCKTYDLSTLNLHNYNASQVTITDACVSVLSSSQYNVTLTTGGSDGPLLYVFSTPAIMDTSESTGPAHDWHPVTGFSLEDMDSQNATAGYVVVQSPPEARNITGYDITFTNENNDIRFNNGCQNVTTAKRTVPIMSSCLYFAEVVSVGPGCDNMSDCPTVITGSIYMNSEKVTVIPPTFTVFSTSTPIPWTTTTTKNTTQSVATTTDISGQPTDDGQRKKTILIGCLVGFFGAGLLIGVVLCVYRWRKHGRAGLCQDPTYQFNKLEGGMELSVQQNGPSVLILYSCDCDYHEQVVIEFASYMQHNFSCKISMDLWEQNDIQERGAISWLMDKLETTQYIMVVCSVGARLKCARGRRSLRPKENRPVPDIFSAAVDYVAEKMWLMKSEGREDRSLLVVCFDYSGENDIPPKLDRAPRFYLPNDLASLFCHLHLLEYEEGIETTKNLYGRSAATFCSSETGSQLDKALCNAKEFFSNNPTWLLEELEQAREVPSPPKETESSPISPALQQVVPPPSSFTSEPLYKVNGHIPQLLNQDVCNIRQEESDVRRPPGGRRSVSGSPSASEGDALLEDRLNSTPPVMTIDPQPHRSDKRKTPFQNGWTNMLQHSKKLMHRLKSKESTEGYSNLSEPQLFSPEPDRNSLRNKDSPPGNDPNQSSNSPEGSSEKNNKSGDTVSIDSDSICNDEDQLKKDMEFIRNYQCKESPDFLQLMPSDCDPCGGGDQHLAHHSTLGSLPSSLSSSPSVMNGSLVLPSLVPSHDIPFSGKHAGLATEHNNNVHVSVSFR